MNKFMQFLVGLMFGAFCFILLVIFLVVCFNPKSGFAAIWIIMISLFASVLITKMFLNWKGREDYVLDTSFLMRNVGAYIDNILIQFANKHNIVFHIHNKVLGELDGLKKSSNEEIKLSARTALKYIKQLQYRFKEKINIIDKEPNNKKEYAKYDYLDSDTDKISVWYCQKLSRENRNVFLLTTDGTQAIAARDVGITVFESFEQLFKYKKSG